MSEGAPPFLPVFLNLSGKTVAVVGGDSAAAAKARIFADSGARVCLISVRPGPEALALQPDVRVIRRGWLFRDFAECALICAGPKLSEAVVQRLAGAAAASEAMFYAIDRPAYSDFSSGASITRGALSVGVSTAGAAPALGQALRREIERLLPQEAGDYLNAAAAERANIAVALEGAPRRHFWARAADSALALMQEGAAPKDEKAWRAWLQKLLKSDAPIAARIIAIPAPKSVDNLTLGQARALSRADIVFVAEDAPDDCLSLLRREAERRPLPQNADAKTIRATLPNGALAVIVAGPQSMVWAQKLAS
ncbi:MAG: NAD(P)-dependent oxidoreductase [Caulobacterales bacterium]